MIEREVKLLLDANAVKRVQVRYAVMADGYMVVINGQPLETIKREPREFKTRFSGQTAVQDWSCRFFR